MAENKARNSSISSSATQRMMRRNSGREMLWMDCTKMHKALAENPQKLDKVKQALLNPSLIEALLEVYHGPSPGISQ